MRPNVNAEAVSVQTTCTRAIKRLREAFANRSHPSDPEVLPNEFLELVEGIERQMFQFESTSNQALLRLYRRDKLAAAASSTSVRGASGFTSRASMTSVADDNPMLVGSDNENVFLVYLCVQSVSLLWSVILMLPQLHLHSAGICFGVG
jgi:hypothetical protein